MTTSPETPDNSFLQGLMKTLVPLTILLIVIAGGLWFVKSRVKNRPLQIQSVDAPDGSQSADVTVGSILPDFDLKPFGEKNTTIPVSKLGNKVTLINFWATWCEACMEEMPSLVKLRKAYKGRGFGLAEIDVDEKPEAVLPRTMKQLGMNFRVFTDADAKLADLFDVHAIPLSVIIDKNRKVLMIENGEMDWNGREFRSQLEKWL